METKVLILDEMIEQGLRDFQRIILALGRVLEVRPAGPRSQRRPRLPGPMPPLSMDPSIEVRNYLTAAEILDSPPPGEAVIVIPPEGSGSGRERAYIRIGLGDASWIGSFEIGYTKIGSISLMMPDNKHLFVSAKGAGYIIDLKTRTLVEQIGTHVAFVWWDAPRTLLMVDHNGMSLEMFGRSRLWETDTISSGGSREISLEDNIIAGEADRGRGGSGFR